ncbi:carboxypeptidase B [Amyelois transitella]|uniref:carboxypeptidase B n=1 Tax=Amyelois transitella TaxID=680683 RepID=UPI00298F7571|nr:carboxypeptidase B [Amyelois transitella]
MIRIYIVALLLFKSCIYNCHIVSYGNYTLYITKPTRYHQLKFLQNLETQKYMDVIYWKKPVKLHYEVHMLINSAQTEMFMERARHYNLIVRKSINDIENAFKNQTVHRYVRLRENSFDWNHYHTLEDIYQWLADVATKCNKECELLTIGKSVEDRDIYAMVFQKNVKRKVIIEAGVHGNEWIAIEFATYLIDRIVNRNSSGFSAMNSFNWYIVPIVNPDGFAYTHSKDRLWRKNRRRFGSEYGVDLNRNFDYNFRAFSSSIDPKNNEYCGPEPFSEPETQALRNFIKQNAKGLKYYFSFHAYGQAIILPYADRVKHIEDYTEMENYGKQAIMRMYEATHNKYSIGTFYDTMGTRVSGDSASWVKRSLRVKYVMTFLLRDDGQYGYALPSNLILPTCKEALVGLETIMTAQARYVPTNLFSTCCSVCAFRIYTILVLCFILNKL